MQSEHACVQNERGGLNLQIIEKEEEYTIVVQCALQLEKLALAPQYGSTPKELASLQKLVKLYEKKIGVLHKELCELQSTN